MRFAFRLLMVLSVLALAACQTGIGGQKVVIEAASGAEALAKVRASRNLPALSSDSTLERAAAQQAAYMASAGKMAHTTGSGRDFRSRMRANGIQGVSAENIAYGGFGPGGLFTAWMNSSGHRRNMLDRSFSRYGLASAADPKAPGRKYWALVLGE